MSTASEKENSAVNLPNSSGKRQKMSEIVNSSINKSEYDEERDTSVSVTVYEDECDVSYFNKSSINRLLSTSMNKRSPLATINKPSGSSSSHNHHQQQVVKVPRKIDDSLIKRLVPKEVQPDPFQSISDEVLVHLFSFLPKKALHRVAVVNERFSRVVQDKTLWIRIDLGGRYVRAEALGIILARGLIILRLAQSRIQSPVFEKDFFAEDYESKLQYLDLSMASIDKPSLVELLAVCRSLKKLSLEAIPIDVNVCRQIAMNKSLEVLNLAMCEGLTQDGVMVIVASLQSLSALNISWTQLKTNCVGIIMDNLTPAIMRLNIAGCRKSLMDKHLKTLVERCQNIVELDVSDCTLLTSTTIEYVSSFKKLEYLSLSRCYNITMTSYLTLNTIKSLMYLDVFGLLSDSGLKHMEKAFKNIEINKFVHSSVARPTVMPRRTSIWGIRTRD